MSQKTGQEKAREIVRSAGYCQMATSVDGQPRVRPMKFVITDEFKFWCSTFVISGKVQEFKQNNKVELCWVDEQKDHLRVAGTVDISGGPHARALEGTFFWGVPRGGS